MNILHLIIFGLFVSAIIIYGLIKKSNKRKNTSKQELKNNPIQSKNSPISTTPSTLKNGETYLINYQNTHNEITQRTITIKKIYRDNFATYINAYCHVREQERTFKLDRIIGYITNIDTGEMLDPAALNPLKNKLVISPKTASSAAHKEISNHNESWFLHHPNDNVSTKADREKLKLTAYRYQIDAYRTAINQTIEEGKDTLILYNFGKYKPSKKPENADKITLIQIDTSTQEGIAKKKLIAMQD